MMKILHLYHDIMNLYGDYANVSAMKRVLEKSGEEVTVAIFPPMISSSSAPAPRKTCALRLMTSGGTPTS